MRKIAHLFFLLLSVVPALAQQPGIMLYSLTEKDGLSDNTVNCFFQDQRGVMWMGTSYGLNSYDGSVIRVFHAADGSGMPSDVINDIKEDQQHTLWMATAKGLCSYDYIHHQFKTYRYPAASEDMNRFYSLAILGTTIWLATEQGLVSFSTATGKFRQHINPAGKPSNRLNKIIADSQGRIWLGSFSGLWSFDEKDETFTAYPETQNDLVMDMLEDGKDRLWFGTWSNGLQTLDIASKKVTGFLPWPGSSTNVLTLAKQASANGHESLWVSNNLSRLDMEAHAFKNISITSAQGKSLTTANRLYCDRDNLLWISTSEGVKIFNPDKQYFTTRILSSYAPLTSQSVALYPLRSGFLLGGEDNGMLMQLTDSLTVIKNYSHRLNHGAATMNIQRDAKGMYWLSTSNGLIIADSAFRQKRFFIHDDKNPSSLPKNFLNGVFIRNDGEVWLLPWRKGVWKLNPEGNSFSRVLTKRGDSLLPGANLSKVLEDRNGKVWLTDYTSGLFCYDPATSSLEDIIPSHRLTNEYLIGDTLWTVAAEAVFAVDIKNKKTTTYLLPAGKNKYEYDFIPDDNGCIWIATKTGLLCFNRNTHTFQQFTADDGIYTNDMDVIFTKLANGNIVLAGTTYVTSFSPRIAWQNSVSAPLLFTGAITDNKEKKSGGPALEFGWDEKNISLNWALLNFSNPLGNRYYYRLDGVNDDWQLAGNRGTAIYSSLAPGRYLFHYKATSSEGLFSGEKTMWLIIHPPFWQTALFRIAVLVLLGIGFYFLVRYFSQRKLKEKVRRLEQQQAIERERNRISRDMHDDLGSGLTKIAVLSEVIKTQPQNSLHAVDSISHTARTLVDNLDELVWALNPKNDSLDKLIAYLAEYTQQYLEDTGIECCLQLPEQIGLQYISEEKRRNIFMVVKEFLSNSVKYSKATRITLTLTQQKKHFTLLLCDDGKGFAPSAQTGMGNGLRNMQQRIGDIGGQAELSSSPQGTRLLITCCY